MNCYIVSGGREENLILGWYKAHSPEQAKKMFRKEYLGCNPNFVERVDNIPEIVRDIDYFGCKSKDWNLLWNL